MAFINFRSRFLLKNLFRGLAALAVIIIAYILLQKFTSFELLLEEFGDLPILVYTIFVVSEVVFGIIPPELFMIWSMKHGAFNSYVLNITLLAVISMLAGILGYYLGANMKKVSLIQPIFNRYIKRYTNTLNRYGGFLIFVGAITPIPFSAICMLVGATNYPFSRFLLIASSRFLRYAVYGFIIYQANI